ncbi:hypothetical protein ACFL1X_12475 [Candidatus Hydrogenedentota bacterium]
MEITKIQEEVIEWGEGRRKQRARKIDLERQRVKLQARIDEIDEVLNAANK